MLTYSRQIFCSAHRTPTFTNPEYFFCLLFEYFFQIQVLNKYQNTPKNVNTARYIKKKKRCAKLEIGEIEIQDL